METFKRFCRERSFFNAVAIQAARALEFVLTSKPEQNSQKRLAARVVVPSPCITKHKVFWFDDVFHLPNCDKLTIYYDTNGFKPKDIGQVVGDLAERLLREPNVGFPKELRLITRNASPQLLASQLQPTYKEIDLARAEWPLNECYAWNVYHLESRASFETFTLLADVEHKHYWLRRGTIEFEQRTLKRRACCGHRRKVMLWVEVGASVSPQSSDGSSCPSASSEEEDNE
ncbi:hypothetical protein AAVH_31204 [Aphelenchoides avenae]|nr:hypothetical protein AAVH_31204 [Aphelenchus avenae]